MVQRNPHLYSLKASYLFPEILARTSLFLEKNPHAPLISLGIGDTTEPLAPFVSQSLENISKSMGTREGYCGYGPEQGMSRLREKIAAQLYQGIISPNDLFLSDGAKCDLGRLQCLFGENVRVAVQDPAYPVYVDGSLIHGVKKICYMPCMPENHFFPDLSTPPQADLLYICSPNNPTGTAANRHQLEAIVALARKHQCIIIYDSAYSFYIQDKALPKSIYEIEGADEVAIEVGSFSKLAGFTGVRLGWTIVPERLRYADGSSVKSDWKRIVTTLFNGASILSQHGGLAVLEIPGLDQVAETAMYYMENIHILRKAAERQKWEVFGGRNAPFLWIRFRGKSSWESFQSLLETHHLVTTPGSGFGPHGEEFVRISGFNSREKILEAAERISS